MYASLMGSASCAKINLTKVKINMRLAATVNDCCWQRNHLPYPLTPLCGGGVKGSRRSLSPAYLLSSLSPGNGRNSEIRWLRNGSVFFLCVCDVLWQVCFGYGQSGPK